MSSLILKNERRAALNRELRRDYKLKSVPRTESSKTARRDVYFILENLNSNPAKCTGCHVWRAHCTYIHAHIFIFRYIGGLYICIYIFGGMSLPVAAHDCRKNHKVRNAKCKCRATFTKMRKKKKKIRDVYSAQKTQNARCIENSRRVILCWLHPSLFIFLLSCFR